MDPRRKSSPNPIARVSGPTRGLAQVSMDHAGGRRAIGSRLPTVAALLALGATLSLGCQAAEPEAIAGDFTIKHSLAPERAASVVEPREHDPAQPLPGMGALEEPTPQPEPTVSPVVKPPPPPHKPYPVKGGAKAVHPTPIPPMAAGGLKPAAPIPPPSKPPKLSGDVAAVLPETT